jgi:hypothetical protein
MILWWIIVERIQEMKDAKLGLRANQLRFSRLLVDVNKNLFIDICLLNSFVSNFIFI